LLLGVGALSVAGARADTPETQPGVDTLSAAQNEMSAAQNEMSAAQNEMSVRAAGARIYLREGGRETELELGATPQRDHLLQLLQQQGPAGVRLDGDPRLIMSSGGGAGFSLRDIARSLAGDKPVSTTKNPPPAATPLSSPKQGTEPRDHNPPADKKY
jgi:hypothetical protein